MSSEKNVLRSHKLQTSIRTEGHSKVRPLSVPFVTALAVTAERSSATPAGPGIISRVNLAANGRDTRALIPTGDKGEGRHRYGNDRGGFGRRNCDVEVSHEMMWTEVL